MRVSRLTALSVLLVLMVVCLTGTVWASRQPGQASTGGDSSMMMAGEYGEAPMLAQLVADGKLPPVEERLPDEPVVIEPTDEVGTYGGTAYVYSTTSLWQADGGMSLANPKYLLGFERDLSWGHPSVAEGYEISDDGKSLTIFLRKGMKWSDGYPFTADDFMFYYEHVMLNKDLTPAIAAWAIVEGQAIEMVKIDDYTIRWDFASPYPSMVGQICASVGGQPGTLWPWGSYQAAHFAEQFHADFVGLDKANQMAKDAGFDSWAQYYWDRTDSIFTMPYKANGYPVLTPYICVEQSMDGWVFERNPFFWEVDTAGNQLPYIDRIVCDVVNSADVIEGKLLTGEVDWYVGAMANMPLYSANTSQGGYKVLTWQSGDGSAAHIQLNLTIDDPVLRQLFRDIRFRRALSHAIDRDDLNKKAFFGLATPRAHTVPPESEYFKPEFATADISFDTAMANQLLDQMGLNRKNSDGFRLGPDGQPVQFTIEATEGNSVLQTVLELIQGYWQAVGIDVRIKTEAFNLLIERSTANQVEAFISGTGQSLEPVFTALPQYFVPMNFDWATPWAMKWSQYYATGGAEGEAPPPELQELVDIWQKMRFEAKTPEERIALGQQIMQSHADNIWIIGTVGLPPVPIMINENMRNVPEKGTFSWDTEYTTPYFAEQFYLRGAAPVMDPNPIMYESVMME